MTRWRVNDVRQGIRCYGLMAGTPKELGEGWGAEKTAAQQQQGGARRTTLLPPSSWHQGWEEKLERL